MPYPDDMGELQQFPPSLCRAVQNLIDVYLYVCWLKTQHFYPINMGTVETG